MQILFSNNKSIKSSYKKTNSIIYMNPIKKNEQTKTYNFIFPYKQPSCCK